MTDDSGSVLISHDQIPVGARSLGAKLVAYVLNISNGEADTLLANGGRLSHAQISTLHSLGGLFEVAKQQRIHNQVLQWSDLHSLTGIKFQGSDNNPFGHLRSQVAGNHKVAITEDLVFNALASMAVEAFPFFLLPRPGDMLYRAMS